MARYLFFCAVFLICTVIVNAQSTAVVELTEENFDKLTSEGKWLVEFFAPWCGFCQRLKPVYEEAAAKIHAEFKGLRLGAVDCTKYSRLQDRFNIRGYPTIKYMRGGLTTDYTGGRTVKDFVDFARRATGEAVQEVTAQNWKEFVSQPVSFILYSESKDIRQMYRSIVEKYQESVSFGATRDRTVLEQAVGKPIEGKHVLYWFNDIAPQQFAQEFDSAKLDRWINARMLPYLPELTGNNWATVVNTGKPIVCAVIDSKQSAHKQYLDEMKKVAIKRFEEFAFGWLDGNRFNKFVSDHGLTAEHWPGFFITEPNKNIHYENTSIGRTAEEINQFLDDVLRGKVEAKGPGSGFFSAVSVVARSLARELRNNPWLLAVVGFVVVLFVIVLYLAITVKDDSEPVFPDQEPDKEKKEKEGKQD